MRTRTKQFPSSYRRAIDTMVLPNGNVTIVIRLALASGPSVDHEFTLTLDTSVTQLKQKILVSFNA